MSQVAVRADMARLLRDEAAGVEETPVSVLLPRLLPYLDPARGLLKSWRRIDHYHDEMKFPHFGGELLSAGPLSDGSPLTSYPGGFGLTDEIALLKFLGEAIERFCLGVYRSDDLVVSSYARLTVPAVDPLTFAGLSARQRCEHVPFQVTHETPLSWAPALDLTTNAMTLVPAQLVYLSYQHVPNERYIYLPITTGAAGGSTFTAAVCRGIYEIVERDSFLLYYLNRLSAPKLDVATIDDEDIQQLARRFRRYLIELHVFDITSDLGIPTFLTLAVDRTGVGPAVTVGLKSHFDVLEAIRGSILESQHSRNWIRRVAEDHPDKVANITPDNIPGTEERGLYWFPLQRLRRLRFLLGQPAEPYAPQNYGHGAPPTTDRGRLYTLLARLRGAGMDVYATDVTLPRFRDLGYRVAKVFIPQATPLYLDERLPCLGAPRLYSAPVTMKRRRRPLAEGQFNHVPHPFL